MLGSMLSMWLRYGLSRRQAAVVVLGFVVLLVAASLTVQVGLFGFEAGAGETGLEMGNVSSSGIGTGKTGGS
ncbi:MAG: hypothetical protein ABEI75_00685 [Halobaculum sp.]